jgi:hypothetical protein
VCLAELGVAMSILAPMSCCTLKLRSYCSITWEIPDSTRMVCDEVKSLQYVEATKRETRVASTRYPAAGSAFTLQ